MKMGTAVVTFVGRLTVVMLVKGTLGCYAVSCKDNNGVSNAIRR